MTIENSNMAMKVWVQNLISTIVLVCSIAAFYTIPFFNNPVFGVITRTQLIIVLLVIYLIIVLIPIVKKYQYVHFSNENNSITIKYYTLGYFSGTKKNIQFPIQEFHGFELKKSFLNLHENLVVFRKMKKGIANYPPVSVTGLNPIQITKLKETLTYLITK